ncbi:universal stress protein [Frankia sp. Mgl5]|uniref:universal stress protein n=1 Tax=Frankia sp. Mgl5 TaxID=2933793 RepID=UPI0020104E3B|nr:universal stress protein [Frankia sp. Mgl5]MCK9925965.1 universal stress protein [Frankia sp. Mgl5]
MTKGEIVVGLDGSPEAEQALRWAVREAGLRQTGVRAVLAWAAAGPASDGSRPPPATSPEHPRWTAQWIVNDVLGRVRDDEPAARIVGRTVFGPAVRMLLAESAGAEMLVLGAHGTGRAAPMLTGSVSLACAHGAGVPVVVVRGPAARWEGGAVVVGVDGSPASLDALDWAVREAELRSARLRVVHVWTPPPVSADGRPTDVDALRHAARGVLDEAVRPYLAGARAGTGVEPVLIGAGVSRALIDEAARAQLLVLGARGRGGFDGLLLGSTGSQCVSYADCPVVIVRRSAQPRSPAAGGPERIEARST